jgi:hypothetical protein
MPAFPGHVQNPDAIHPQTLVWNNSLRIVMPSGPAIKDE